MPTGTRLNPPLNERRVSRRILDPSPMDPHEPSSSATQPVQIGDVVTLTVEQLGPNGDGLCRVNNYVVFVPGTLPDE